MRKFWCFWIIAALFCSIMSVSTLASDTMNVPRISKEKVKTMLGKANVVIVDVRSGPDWDKSQFKIKGAIREDPGTIESWIAKFPKRKILVFYCS